MASKGQECPIFLGFRDCLTSRRETSTISETSIAIANLKRAFFINLVRMFVWADSRDQSPH